MSSIYDKKLSLSERTKTSDIADSLANEAADTFRSASSFAKGATRVAQDPRFKKSDAPLKLVNTIGSIFEDARRGMSQDTSSYKPSTISNYEQVESKVGDSGSYWKSEAQDTRGKAEASADRMGALLSKLKQAKDKAEIERDRQAVLAKLSSETDKKNNEEKKEHRVDPDLMNAFFGSNIETARQVIKSISEANDECVINSIDDFKAHVELIVVALKEVVKVFDIEIEGLTKSEV